jgi:hypothetical protein
VVLSTGIYIEREAVLSAIWKTSAERDVFFPTIILDAIKSIPAVDVRPVVRGHWIDGVCSNCGFFTDVVMSRFFSYCPNCGADMREES